jgi:hypothetical protein
VGALIPVLARVAGIATAGIVGVLGLKSLGVGPQTGDKTQSQSEYPYPGYHQGDPPPFVDPLGHGLLGGLAGSTEFSESFYVVVLILGFIVLVRYLHH